MIKFNKNNGSVEPFTIILSSRDYTHLGQIVNVSNVNYTGNLNAANELSFVVNKTLDGVEERLWDEIYDLRLAYVKELDEYYEINVSFVDQHYMTKTITCTSLCEAELSQVMLVGVEINTETDILRDDYVAAKFWTESTDKEKIKTTLLYRIISDAAPAYSIKHVDPSLCNLQREFSINGSSVYDWLVGDCAKEFNCLFMFDSTDRTISVYDLYYHCPICKNRSILADRCQHILTADDISLYNITNRNVGDVCNHEMEYFGNDTTILVSTENLTEEVRFETDIDKVKNCFRLEGGDEDFNAVVKNINPNGTNKLINFSTESMKDMPEGLVLALKSYKEKYDKANTTAVYLIDMDEKVWFQDHSVYIAHDYRSVENKYKQKYNEASSGKEELGTIDFTITGFANVMKHYYQTLDFYAFLQSSMMPTRVNEIVTAQTEAEKLDYYNLGQTVGVSASNIANLNQTQVENAVLNYAKVFVKTGYVRLEIDASKSEYTYNETTKSGKWKGRFKVTSYNLPEDDQYKTVYSPIITLIITTKYDDFIKQKLMKKISSLTEKDEYALFDMLNIDLSPENFYENCKYYSLNRLTSFRDAIETLLSVLQETKQGDEDAELYDQYYLPFWRKLNFCNDEIETRTWELTLLAKYTNGYLSGGLLYQLNKIVERVRDELNIEKFLDEYGKNYHARYHEKYPYDYNYVDYSFYKLFTTYLREDTYNNSNYISDGLNQNELFANAQEFYSRAEEELIKSSTYQHRISANMNNLLAMEEFKPIINYFELGNWIRVEIDDEIFRLRLNSYSINYDDLTTINTNFTDATLTALGYNDIQSILSKATSMASSYGAVTRKAELGKFASNNISEWLKNGFDSSKTHIMNNENEEIEISNVGITAKTYNDTTDSYDPAQLRITHNVLAFTENNWETVSTALGRFTLTYHKPKAPGDTTEYYMDSYGLVAQAVLAGNIVGTDIEGSNFIAGHIQCPGDFTYIDLDTETKDYNNFLCVKNRFSVDKEGNIKSYGGHFGNLQDTHYIDLSENNEYDYFLKCGNSFTVSKEDGKIISSGGHFGSIDDEYYLDMNCKKALLSDDLIIDDSGYDYFIYCGDKFSVKKDGKIVAAEGKIGGFSLSDTYLYSGSDPGSNSDGDIAIAANSTFSRTINTTNANGNNYTTSINNLVFAIGKNFAVDSEGNLYAGGDGAFTGNVYARGGKIANFTIGTDCFSSGKIKFSPNYLLIGDDDILSNGLFEVAFYKSDAAKNGGGVNFTTNNDNQGYSVVNKSSTKWSLLTANNLYLYSDSDGSSPSFNLTTWVDKVTQALKNLGEII